MELVNNSEKFGCGNGIITTFNGLVFFFCYPRLFAWDNHV